MAVTKFYPCNALILDATQDQAIVGTEGIEDTWASTKQSYASSDILLDSTVPSLTNSYLRFELNKGFEYNGTHRSELRSHWNKTYEGWVAFRIYVGDDYVIDDATEILHQMHAIGGSPQISFQCRNDELFFQTKQGTFASNSSTQHTLGNIVRNQWITIVYNYKVAQVNGFLRVWRNGIQLVDFSGTLGYSDATEPPYRKFGIYKWLWSTTYPSSSTQRVVFYDEIRFGDATATYAEMNPDINVPPSVSITYPTEGSTFQDNEPFEAIADASDSDGTVSQVQMFYNGIGANIEVNAPYEFPLNLSAGQYELIAVAEDNDGATTDSISVNITIVHNSSIYVSPDGSDSNLGTEVSPFLTIDHAITYAEPGDTIYLKRGGKYNSLTITNKDGLVGSLYKFNAYGTGVNPIISSFVTPTTWVSEGTNLWSYTDIEFTTVNLLRIGTSVRKKGRWPKTGYWYITGATGNTEITDTVNLATSPNFVGGEVVAKKTKWIQDTQKVTAQTSTTVTTEVGSPYSYQAEYGYFFQNHINCLTEEKDWYYDDVNKKVVIYSTINPISLNISISKDQYSLFIDNSNYYEFNNIDFEGAYDIGIFTSFSDNITFNNCRVRYQGRNGLQTYVSDDIVFNDCDFEFINNTGINLRDNSQRFSITDSRIKSTGVIEGASGNSDGSGIGIYINNSEHDANINNNYLENIGYSGIYYRGNNCQVVDNYVNGACTIKADGAAFYTFGNPTTPYTNILVRGNIGENSIGNIEGTPYTEADGAIYYVDDNSRNITLDRNYATNASYGFYLHNVQDLTITNNIAYNNRIQFRFADDSIALDILNLTINNNKFIANTGQLVYEIRSDYGSPYNYGTINNNQIDSVDNNAYRIYHVGTSDTTSDLAFWRTNTGFDSLTTEVIYDRNGTELLYNDMDDVQAFVLGGTYTDLWGVQHINSISLNPNDSVFLYTPTTTVPDPDPNIKPTVSIIYPFNSRKYREGNPLPIQVTASDSDGSVTKIEYYINNIKLGESTSEPYIYEIDSLTPGIKHLTARATDNIGDSTVSDVVEIEVLENPIQESIIVIKGNFKVIDL